MTIEMYLKRNIIDSEGLFVGARWVGVVFTAAQAATYYRPYPQGIAPFAAGIVVAFAICAAALTAWWGRLRRADVGLPRRFEVISLVLDAAFVTALTWVYAFDVDTAIFAVLYIVALEAAIRFGARGAFVTMSVLALLYAARDVWASHVYGFDLLFVSVTFRTGIGFIIGWVAGTMADRCEQEHKLVLAALSDERDLAQALRSLDELRSTFLAAISHELRTPLTSILGFSLTIRERAAELRPDTKVMLDQVVRESQHLEQLLQDLLDIEQMGRGRVAIDRHTTDLVLLADGIADRIRDRSGRRVTVSGSGVEGVIDGPKVARILHNLLTNAVRYSPDGGEVVLRICRHRSGVLLIVDDDGPGVPLELRTRIFSPFERGALTSSHQPGTGIGLSLVDRFSRLHGGYSWVESRGQGAGASFRVYLPDGPEGRIFASVLGEPWGQPPEG